MGKGRRRGLSRSSHPTHKGDRSHSNAQLWGKRSNRAIKQVNTDAREWWHRLTFLRSDLKNLRASDSLNMVHRVRNRNSLGYVLVFLIRSQYKEIAKQQAPTHHRIATHARGKEGSCELTKEERIISTPTSNQDAIIVAYIAIVLANHSNRDKITSNHDMVLLEPGLARDAELGTLGLRGDDEAIIVVPEDGGVTLGANIESMKVPDLSTYPVIQSRHNMQ